MTNLIGRLDSNAETCMRAAIPRFHRYKYDSILNYKIVDGGNDMYDDGNFVSF